MLRLGIENVASLTSGDPVEVTLAEHGLVIGRAAHADWTLPDSANHISSVHCEVDYRDGRYFLTDTSTNGTFINGARDRPAGPVQLRDGDLVQIGHYQIRVEEVAADGAGHAAGGGGTAGAFGGGIDWGAGAEAAARPASPAQFGREAARPLFQSGDDPLMRAFAPPQAATPAAPDPFGVAARAPASDPFGMGAPPPAPDPFGVGAPSPAPDPFGVGAAPSSAFDPFGIAAAPPGARAADPFSASAAPAAAVDPFGIASPPRPAVAGDPFGMGAIPAAPAPAAATNAAAAPAAGADPWAVLSGAGAVDFGRLAPTPAAPRAVPSASPSVVPGGEASPAATPPAASDALFDRLLAATGVDRRDLGARTPETVANTIGQLLRQTADGLFRLLEARTRVRHQFGVGAQVTTFQRAGNNPLKWTRSPDHALKQMIGEPGPGFLDGTQAVRGAFEDLQAHEMAMMAAMQEAMQETIRRFAPDAIRARIGARGWLKSVLPGSREATLWRAYESEFSAFADESEAAYLDVFARQFKKAYERIVAEAGQKD